MENHKRYLEIAPGKSGYHVNEKRVMGSNHSFGNAVEVARYVQRQVERGDNVGLLLHEKLRGAERKRTMKELMRIGLENLVVHTENI